MFASNQPWMNNASQRTKMSHFALRVSTLPCKIRKQRFYYVSAETLTLKYRRKIVKRSLYA